MRSPFTLPSLLIIVSLGLLAGAVLRHPSPLPIADTHLQGTHYRVGLWAYVWQTDGDFLLHDEPDTDGVAERPTLKALPDDEIARTFSPDCTRAPAPLLAVGLRGIIRSARSALGPVVETQSGHIDRLLILLLQVAPFGLALVVWRRWLERRGYPEGTVLLCVAVAALGTGMAPAMATLNLYAPATVVIWLLVLHGAPSGSAVPGPWRRHAPLALGTLGALAIHPLAIGPALIALAAPASDAPASPSRLATPARLAPWAALALVAAVWLAATGGWRDPFPFLTGGGAPAPGATFFGGALAVSIGADGFLWRHPIVLVALAGLAAGGKATRRRIAPLALAGALLLGFAALLHRDGFHSNALALTVWWVPFWLPLLPEGVLALSKNRWGRALAAVCLAVAIVMAGFALAGATADRPAGPFGATLIRSIVE